MRQKLLSFHHRIFVCFGSYWLVLSQSVFHNFCYSLHTWMIECYFVSSSCHILKTRLQLSHLLSWSSWKRLSTGHDIPYTFNDFFICYCLAIFIFFFDFCKEYYVLLCVFSQTHKLTIKFLSWFFYHEVVLIIRTIIKDHINFFWHFLS